MAAFADFDLSRIEGGTLVLNYSGPGDFGVAFPIEKALEGSVSWELVAPSFEIVSEFIVSWGQAPIDRNTGEPIPGLGDPITIPFMVRASVLKLLVQADSFDTRPLQRGVSSRLLTLTFDNITNDSRADIGLQSIRMQMIDRDGKAIDAADLISPGGTNFFSGGEPISELTLIDGDLVFNFENRVIFPGDRLEMQLYLMLLASADIDYFNLRLDGDMIEAEIMGGPQAGQPAPVSGLFDRAFDINLPQAIIAENLGESFKNYPNPFNPNHEATEFRYYLSSESDVDIYIYTATGEKVRHLRFNAGGTGGSAQLNTGVFWDGRNGDGELVLNGVYVALIKVAVGDLTAKVKMAVVK